MEGQNILAVRTDKNGMLWIGTQDGVTVFDGRQARPIAGIGGRGVKLGGTAVSGFCEDSSRNVMWALSSYGGVDGIDLNTYKVVRSLNQDGYGIDLKSQSIRSGVIVGGLLWYISTSGLNSLDLRSGRNYYPPIQGPPGINLKGRANQKIVRLNNELLLLLNTELGIIEFNSRLHRIRLVMSKRDLDLDTGKEVSFWGAEVLRNRLIIASNQGLRTILATNGRYTLSSDLKKSWLYSEEITCCCPADNDAVIVGTSRGLFEIKNGDRTGRAIDQESTESKYGFISVVHNAGNGLYWVGAQNGVGILRSGKTPFRAYMTANFPQSYKYHVYTILPWRDSVLIGTNNGLYRSSRFSSRASKLHDGSLYGLIQPLNDSSWLISCNKGLLLYWNGSLENALRTYPELYELSGDIATSALQISDSLILFGNGQRQGAYAWNRKARKIYKIEAPTQGNDVVKGFCQLPNDEVLILHETSLQIWSVKSGVSRVQRLYSVDKKLPIGILMDVCRLKESFWFAAYGAGLIKTDRNFRISRIFDSRDGLTNLGLYKVFPVGDSSLYVTSNDGLYRMDINTGKLRRYSELDGLHANVFEEGCGIMSESVIYAGGFNGYSKIDPSKFTTNTTPPKVYINRIYVDRPDKAIVIDTTNLELARLEIPSDVLQTKLYFSGINYSNPERTTFAYRIRENDTAWVDIGTDNSVTLIGLAPNTYHLEVKAANEDGYWSTPAALTLVYLPKWYQTWWFKVLLGLIVAGGGYGLYRMRLNQILRQQKIRREVASDLHDDIGSSLNSVKVFAHLASADPAKPEYIRNIEQNLEQATIGLRDMIWILDDKLDTIDDLCQRLGQLSARPAEAIGIQVVFQIDEGLQRRVLSKNAKRNLFLIAKEAINNSVKYAQCRTIRVAFNQDLRKLTLSIRDDGKGFDQHATQFGYGLENMRLRADQIHFRMRIESDPTGTNLSFTEK